jgi:radical SAM protein with 4Fe4S-binding SPASM domain
MSTATTATELDFVVQRAKRLFGQYSWFKRMHHPAVMVRVVTPARTHWSGVDIRCWRRNNEPGTLKVTVRQMSASGTKKVREVRVPLVEVDDLLHFPVYWEPIEHAVGHKYLVIVQQLSASGRWLESPPLFFSWKGDSVEAIYSNPDATLDFPEAVLFSPVTSCNLNCIHCISRHSRDRVSVFSDAAWEDLAAAAKAGRLDHLRTDYSGDLLFADRRHGGWLDKIKSLDIPFTITTHGNDLNAENIAKLMDSRLFSINFSIDTFDPVDYPKIRRGARPLEEVLDNIRQFMAARNQYRPDVETILSFVLMRRNLTSLYQGIDFCAELGFSQILGGHLHAYTSDMAGESLHLEPARYARTFDELFKKAAEKNLPISIPVPIRTPASHRGHAPCPYPWSTMVILGNGDVMGCCVPGTKVGNLRDSTIEQIWKGDAMREFRRHVNSPNPPDICSVCPMRRLENNYASYVPGLSEPERKAFEERCFHASEHGDEPYVRM